MMKIAPLNEQVLIHRDKPRDTTDGGIAIPDTAKTADIISGLVLAVGPGRVASNGATRTPINTRPGHRVFFKRYAFTELNIPDRPDVGVVEECELLARVVEE